ncbi:ECF transporter S component [Chryseomicrobium palamuruense]|uniref:ECF transporter S component n=1 Tax=Chryseomicrobium palamuruense TaxID=682973 RepID=A0ABV8USN5_9BACL
MLAKWKLKEVVLMSLLAVVFGIIYLVFVHIGNIWSSLIGPIAYEWIFGVWFLVSIVAMAIIRKPGAALISEVMAATIEVLIGNALGPRLILVGLVQGLGAEAAFAATRYRRFDLPVYILAGVLAAIFSFVYGYLLGGFAALSPWYVLLMLGIRILSGAVIAGYGGHLIVNGLYATGSLRGYAIARQKRDARA